MIKFDEFKKYLKKSKDPYGRLYAGGILLEEEWKGFCIVEQSGNTLVVQQCYGDGKHWDKEIMKLAKKLKCNKISFYTRRNYKAFEKKFGYKLDGYVMTKEVE